MFNKTFVIVIVIDLKDLDILYRMMHVMYGCVAGIALCTEWWYNMSTSASGINTAFPI